MKTLETIILRTLFFVPVAIIQLIWALYSYVRVMILYCKFGGENIIYPKRSKCIADVYNLLENKLND